jgi:hypothetical protein
VSKEGGVKVSGKVEAVCDWFARDQCGEGAEKAAKEAEWEGCRLSTSR